VAQVLAQTCKANAVSERRRESHSALPRNYPRWDVSSDPAQPPMVRVLSRGMSEVLVAEWRVGPCHGRRGPVQMKSDDRAYFCVSFALKGHQVCQTTKTRFVLEPGDITTWLNTEVLSFDVPKSLHRLTITVPVELMESVLPRPTAHSDLHIKGNSGPGILVAGYLNALADNLHAIDEQKSDATVKMTLDLLGTAITASASPASTSRRSQLFERIVSFVDRELEDSELSPVRIATAHGISARYLHLLFADRGETVRGRIRARRLARCWAELAQNDKRLTVTEIAFRWGFNDVAHFSRTFKARYGLGPRAFRQAATGQRQ
jgi:AraC family transcriptional activator of tynA and feaB